MRRYLYQNNSDQYLDKTAPSAHLLANLIADVDNVLGWNANE
jgi:hypothetical protein